MVEWEYRKIDLGYHRPRDDEVDVLNNLGADGWELVAVTSNNVAYMRRPAEDVQPRTASSRDARTVADDGAPNGAKGTYEVKPKYRDPTTGEVWSGRGRMATWLKRKQDAGEDIKMYLIANPSLRSTG